MLVILDTDVLIAGIRSPFGASSALLEYALEGVMPFILTVPLLLEYEAVALRRENREASGFSVNEMNILLDALVAMAKPSQAYYTWRPQLRDAGDELVLEAAINGGASHLISFNHRDFANIPQRFGVRLCTPRDALFELRKTLS